MTTTQITCAVQIPLIQMDPDFPEDVLFCIFSKCLKAQDIQSLICTNQRFYKLISANCFLWNALLAKHFPHISISHHNLEESKELYKRLITTDNNIKAGKFRQHTLEEHRGTISCLFIHKDTLFSGSTDHSIKAWDLAKMS